MASNSAILVMTLLGFFGVSVLGAYLFQNALLYLPDTYQLSTLVRMAHGSPVQLWPSADVSYRGLMAPPRAEKARGTIIVFHGNAGSAFDRTYYARALTPLGYRVLLAEYPGYGARGGSVGESNLVADAVTTIRAVRQQFDGLLYVWGESLGCGVATAIASDRSLAADGLVLITPWRNLPELAQSIYWFLPAKWLVKDKYDNVANLEAFSNPVAVLLAEVDEIIPNKQTMALFEAIRSTKRLWVFRNAGHNSWPTAPDEKWWREVTDFISGAKD